MLKVSFNDTILELAPNTSLLDALPLWETNKSGVRYVVAVNKEFVPRSNYAGVILREGDEIDVVRPVWGG